MWQDESHKMLIITVRCKFPCAGSTPSSTPSSAPAPGPIGRELISPYRRKTLVVAWVYAPGLLHSCRSAIRSPKYAFFLALHAEVSHVPRFESHISCLPVPIPHLHRRPSLRIPGCNPTLPRACARGSALWKHLADTIHTKAYAYPPCAGVSVR